MKRIRGQFKNHDAKEQNAQDGRNLSVFIFIPREEGSDHDSGASDGASIGDGWDGGMRDLGRTAASVCAILLTARQPLSHFKDLSRLMRGAM